MQEQRKYAAWKATDIGAALKRGEVPRAGPPAAAGSAEAELNALIAADAQMPGSATYIPMEGQSDAYPDPYAQQPSQQPPPLPSRQYQQPRVVSDGHGYDDHSAGAAAASGHTACRWMRVWRPSGCVRTLWALQFDDPTTAVRLLRQALAKLGAS